jgi:peptidoglycan hydrolase CwlO-like protein
MTVLMNTRVFALSAILALVFLTAFTYEVKRLFALENSIDNVSNTANYQGSEIEDLRSVIEDLQSEIEDLRSDVENLQSER